MDIEPVVNFLGFKWRVPGNTELIIGFSLIFLVVGIYFLFRYLKYLENLKKHEYQFLLFKAKHIGLTSFQYKIIRGITEILKLKKPSEILKNRILFEKSISSFFDYITEMEQNNDNTESICRDIVITYEKIYHGSKPRKQIESFDENETGTLLYAVAENQSSFIVKLIDKLPGTARFEVLKSLNEVSNLNSGSKIKLNFWRAGDAEYSFEAEIFLADIKNRIIETTEPVLQSRFNPVRVPYIETIIPCVITVKPTSPDADPVKAEGIINKINTEELVLRSVIKMDFKHNYNLLFKLYDSDISVDCRLLSDRTVSSETNFFYTFRFSAMTESGKNTIRKFVMDHM